MSDQDGSERAITTGRNHQLKPLAAAGKGLQVDVWSAGEERPIALELTHRKDGDAALAVTSVDTQNRPAVDT